ncbi:hypothetical protein [Limnoglobus roseus]|uniref:Uncharacterized protein n=1 Tax=Limnoglobus roseus TaxID=2598579 RepID=A0A5C1AKW6_9BACT|nr:hypothetical protein [Limnoglobus roseus]QEL19570.1 hypothetical protein PX52LOC_06646 [Limnoglobus roseus]
MKQHSVRDLAMALYGAGDAVAKIDVLSRIVIDLLVEVEALRGAVHQSHGGGAADPVHAGYDIPCHDKTLTDGKAAYPTAYVDAAYALHNAAGSTGGVEKLLARFYSTTGAEPREALMLRRLGYSDAEISRFKAAVEHAEQFS